MSVHWGEYGRILGTNSVWVTLLISFHCVFSITIPILLVNQMYPDQAGKRWISDKGLKQLGSLFAADVLFGFVFMTNYYPGPLELSIFLVLIVLLFYLAYRPAAPTPSPSRDDCTAPRSFFFLGAAYSWGLFISGWYMTTVGLSPRRPDRLDDRRCGHLLLRRPLLVQLRPGLGREASDSVGQPACSPSCSSSTPYSSWEGCSGWAW